MNKIGLSFKPRVWLMALAIPAFVAGCGTGGMDNLGPNGGGGETSGPPPTAAGAGQGLGGGRGPAPLNLGTSANYVILTVNALTNKPPSIVTGNIGLTKQRGSLIGLTCAEVSGEIVTIDRTGTFPCRRTDAAGLNQDELDADDAYNDAVARTADYTDLADGNIGGLNLGPATYVWGAGVSIDSNLRLTGGPNDVWIFRMWEGLTVSPGVQIILQGGALPQNVFWAPRAAVEVGSEVQFKGILLPAAAVFMGNRASINGKLLAAEAHLDQNTVSP